MYPFFYIFQSLWWADSGTSALYVQTHSIIYKQALKWSWSPFAATEGSASV